MKVGDLYNFTNNRIRIIMFDDKEVFYQTVNEEDAFIYAEHKTVSYYRVSQDHFVDNADYIKSLDFTENELEIHRPDLPLRLNCFSGFFWPDNAFKKDIDFNTFLKSVGITQEKLTGLDSSKIVLFPTSQKQSNKKSILLENKNGRFSGRELLIQCFKIQSEYVQLEKPYFSSFKLAPDRKEEKRLSGIGIYRIGIKGNVPSYYLGGEISMSELEIEKSYIIEE
ncbi:MAG: hypothetical protein ACI857_000210 [Arenicella sp.]|jgi:hypothetical protein